MNPQESTLSKRNLWSYTLGSIGRDTAVYLFSAYLLTFALYTKTLNDAQFSVMSIAMMAARVLDGLSGPVMGNILDVTRTKWGKFKPWILVGTVLCSIIYYISFTNSLDGWNYVILFTAVYFIYSIVFNINDISYWGMLPSLASGKADRDLLTSRTALFAGIGQAVASVVVPTFTAGEMVIGGSAVRAYAVIAVIFVALFAGMQGITIFGVKEKPLQPAATIDKVSLRTIFGIIKNNDQLSWCMAIYLFQTVGSSLINSVLGMNYIYFEFGYSGFLFTVFSALGAAASALVMLFFAPISKRFTRDRLMRLSLFGVIGGSVFMFLTGLLVPGGAGAFSLKFVLMMLGNLFAFTGQNIFYLVLMICISNTIEYNQWKTGARAEGIIYAVRPFITKVGNALTQGVVLVAFLLTGLTQFTNQIAAFEKQADHGLISGAQKTAGIEAVLAGIPPGKTMALLFCITIVPTLFALAAYYLYNKKFTITEERYEEILGDLREREATASAPSQC